MGDVQIEQWPAISSVDAVPCFHACGRAGQSPPGNFFRWWMGFLWGIHKVVINDFLLEQGWTTCQLSVVVWPPIEERAEESQSD